ncbi:GntR family transcriptional regulator [Sporolactobacillus putidus]|nr:GntR family transcriptional regulator [Sporolactobacillus putidus]
MEKKMMNKIDRQTLSEKIYIEMKKAIVDMYFKPGERLNDGQLAAQFGVSRTPVREAFKRLEDEGLIESVPGSMTRVANISTEEARHAFSVVAALHALAARLAVPNLAKKDLEDMIRSNEELRAALDARDAAKAIQTDTRFHQVIIDRAANPEINDTLERITPKILRLERARFLSSGSESICQHEAIIRACKKGAVEEAMALVEKNWLTLSEWASR